MAYQKYILLALITASLTISESCGVNFQLRLLGSTAVAQTRNSRKAEADRLLDQGSKQFNTSKFQQALLSWKQSLAIYREIGNRKGIAKSLNNLGIAYRNLGDYPKAIDYLQQSLAIEKEMGNRKGVAASLGNLGIAYRNLGDYRKAIDYYQQTLAISKEMGNRKGVAASLNNLGNAYRNLGYYRKAIDYHKQSLVIDKEMGNRKGVAASLNNLGLAYRNLGYYRKAIDYYQQSLVIDKEMGNRLGVAKSLGNLGLTYHILGDYRKAIDYHQQTLAISKEIGNRLGVAKSLGNLGLAYSKLGDHHKAIDYHQQSLAIDKEMGNRLDIANSLSNLGNTFRKSEQLAAAEKHLRQAIKIWEDIRKLLLTKDSWKVSIFEGQARTYRLLQQVLIARKQPQQALVIAEQGRTRALIEILHRKIIKKPNLPLIPPPPTLDQIKQVAQKQNATFVEYSVTPGEIYIWVIPPQGEIQFRPVPLNGISLQKLVKITREKQLNVRGDDNNNPPSESSPTNHLKQLHKILIEPIAEFLPKDEQQKIIFIPHQELFLVPFVALQDEKNKYLIEKHTILTAPSIQALSLNQPEKQTTPILPRGKDVLIVGNPTMPKTKVGKEKETLKQLEGAEEEAKIIAEKLETKAIIGSQATEAAIVKKMSSAKLIHFATHGLLDGINAIDSPGAIAFTPDAKNDGFLTTSEIMDKFGLPGKQKLQADLVVLSACDTGTGDIRGEGVIGLSRAFMASGVTNLVVSLWKVPDEQTVKLMTEFYTNIYEGKLDKAQGMRQAMLKMLKDKDGDPDPTNWAAFTVIGNAK